MKSFFVSVNLVQVKSFHCFSVLRYIRFFSHISIDFCDCDMYSGHWIMSS